MSVNRLTINAESGRKMVSALAAIWVISSMIRVNANKSIRLYPVILILFVPRGKDSLAKNVLKEHILGPLDSAFQ